MSVEEKKYNLQQLRQELLKLDIDQDEYVVLNDLFIKKVYGVFGDDNSFVFALENNYLKYNFLVSPFNLPFYLFDLLFGAASLISKKYYLVDYFCRRVNLSGIYGECFNDNDWYEYNGINYCVTLLTKIVPASYLQNLTLSNMGMIQDRINVFLAENPDFVSEMFFCEESFASGMVKKKTLD